MSTSESCKDGASKSNDDGVCDVNDKLLNMSMGDKDIIYQYAPIVEKKVPTTYAINVNKSSIATLYVKGYTKRSIRKIVRNISDLQLRNITKNLELQRSYMMKSCLNNHRQKKIVQFVSYVCHHLVREGLTFHAVES